MYNLYANHEIKCIQIEIRENYASLTCYEFYQYFLLYHLIKSIGRYGPFFTLKLNYYYYYIAGLKQFSVNTKSFKRTKYKRPFSIGYREQNPMDKVCIRQYISRIVTARFKQEEEV